MGRERMITKVGLSGKEDLESIRELIADGKLQTRDIRKVSLRMAKALKSKEEAIVIDSLAADLKDTLEALSSWLERQQDVYSLLDGRGLNRALRSTLVEKYNLIGNLLGVESNVTN